VCTPTHCRRCGQALHGSESQPYWPHVGELPIPLREDQQLRLRSAHGRLTTCGALPAGSLCGLRPLLGQCRRVLERRVPNAQAPACPLQLGGGGIPSVVRS
jgi:hypothetical protein